MIGDRPLKFRVDLTEMAVFVRLAFLPAATLTLLLNFSPVFVAMSSGWLNHEPPSLAQWGGILLSAIGTIIYFRPLDIPARQILGLIVALLGVLANSSSALLGRQVNYHSGLSPLLITSISMGIDGLLLLIVGDITQGFGQLDLKQWLILIWLTIVNTAIAFTLWINTLRSLTAVESSIINGTLLPQIAILARLFLGGSIKPQTDHWPASRRSWHIDCASVAAGTDGGKAGDHRTRIGRSYTSYSLT